MAGSLTDIISSASQVYSDFLFSFSCSGLLFIIGIFLMSIHIVVIHEHVKVIAAARSITSVIVKHAQWLPR